MIVSLAAAPSWAQQEPAPTPAPAPTQPTPAPKGGTPVVDKVVEAAKKKAHTTGKRVEIPSQQTESTTVFANPDGKTLRMELHAQPIRIKKAKGDGFTPIDTTLVEENGVIKPKAVKGGLTLSAGEDTVLLKSKSARGTAEIAAPDKLPKPKLTGSTATYPSAYGEGVDLVVTATATGFRQKIVIREQPSGPVTFRLPIDLPKGVSYGKSESGQPTLLAEDGKKIADLPRPLVLDAVAAAPDGPIDAGKVGTAPVSVEPDGSALLLAPDAAFLADPAVTYPVTVMAADSDWWEPALGNDTFVNSADYPDGYANSGLDRILVGKSNSGSVRWRSYIRFDEIPADSLLLGGTVDNADLVLWNHLSNDCGEYVGSGITARRVTERWDVSTLTWSNQPLATSAGANTEYGAYLPGCTRGYMNYEHDLIHSVNGIVQEWADGEPNYGFQLAAGNESDITNWRRYRTQEYTCCSPGAHPPQLTVDFTPAPRTSIVYSTLTEQTTNPTYEEAVALQDYQPEEIETAAVSDQFTSLLQQSRNTGDAVEAYPVGTDKLDTSGAEGDPERPGDDVAPAITSVTPSPGAVGVPVDTTLSVTFSERVVGSFVTLKGADGTEVSGITSADDTGTKALFTPVAPLAADVQYTATVSGAQDIWDNTADDYSWTFTTVSDCPLSQDPDTTAPSIRSHSPAADATGAGTGGSVSVTFCETVQNPVLTLKNAAGAIVEGSVSLDQAATTVTFTPAASLTADTRYTAEISGASDAAGNVMTAYSWFFTTTPAVPPDTTPPAVTETTPGNGAVDVALGTQLRVSYSEPVTGAQITLAESGGATVTGTVSMAEDDVAVFTPSALLKAGKTYTATASGATDVAGNTQTVHSWSFTTVAAAAEPVNPNPYFESEIDPWYSYYVEDELTRSTERAHEGTASAKFVPSEGTWGAAAAEVSEISEGVGYGLSGWFYPAATSDDGFNFGIDWYDAGWEPLSSDNFPIEEDLGRWQQISGQVSAPAGAAHAVIYVDGAATIYFDEVTLVPADGLASTRSGDAAKKTREHGPSSLYLPEGQPRKKAETRAKASTTAESGEAVQAAETPFNYDHISMEDCLEVARQAGIDPGMGRGNVAHLVVRPYSTCWSRYINVINYVYARKLRKWILSAGKKDSVRLQFQATWVMHTYLGNATGDGVVNGGTSNLKPQQIKMWTKISNVKTYTLLDNVTTGDDDELLKLEVKPTADSGSTCTVTSGTSRQTSLAGWKADGDDEFVLTMQDTDGDKADKCTVRPTMVDVDDEWTLRPMYLWSSVAYDQKGQILGKYNGGGDPSGNDPNEKPYTPHVRCDWYRVSNADPEGEGTVAAATTTGVHTGACIFPLAKRIFVMSKSKDASFLQVIQHIEAALKQNTGVSDNKYTVPPLRDNETQDPPLKGVLGTEKTKLIPGNWAAPMGTDPNKVEPGDPLIKDKAGNQKKNRNVFSRSFKVGGTSYTSYCQYYFPENYREPLLSLLDPVYKKTECDEYPFASTKNGAGYAADNGMKNHYSLRAVGKSHNSTAQGSHGRALGSFYNRNRVLPNDNFWVWIVN